LISDTVDTFSPSSTTMVDWRALGIIISIVFPLILADASLELKFCCSEDQQLRIKQLRNLYNEGNSTKCAPSYDERFLILENEQIYALDTSKQEGDEERNVRMTIKNGGDMDFHCGMGTVKTEIDLNSTVGEPKNASESINLYEYGRKIFGRGCVRLDGKPICQRHDGYRFDGDAARVACRMLGYERGYTNDEWCNIDENSEESWSVRCNGYEEDLHDCNIELLPNCYDNGASVRCEGEIAKGSRITVDGSLIAWDRGKGAWKTFEPNSFCLDGNSAVACNSKKVFPYLIEKLFSNSHGEEIKAYAGSASWTWNWEWGTVMFINQADKDDSNTVDLKEFEDYVKEYIKILFNIFDSNKNGGIDAETEGKLFDVISLEIVDEVANQVFSWFDASGNNVLSFTEDMPLNRNENGSLKVDKDGDGRVSLDEAFYESMRMTLSEWPRPLYKIYSHLDADLNEELSKEEAIGLVNKVFAFIDGNADCKITSDEIVTMVKNIGLPNGYDIGIKMLLESYTQLVHFIVPQVLKKADRDNDGKTTYEEMMDLDDWDWVDTTMIPEIISLGANPMGYGIITYFGGSDMRGWRYRRQGSEIERDLSAALDSFWDHIDSHDGVINC